jgi:hypothetical protein
MESWSDTYTATLAKILALRCAWQYAQLQKRDRAWVSKGSGGRKKSMPYPTDGISANARKNREA